MSPRYSSNLPSHPQQTPIQNTVNVDPQEQQQSPLNMSSQQQQPPLNMLYHHHHHQQQQPQQQQSAGSQAGQRGNDQAIPNVKEGLVIFDKMIAGMFKQRLIDVYDIDTIRSTHIDQLAYKAYTFCIENNLLSLAGTYSAMMNEVKLRALALLNLMAPWWFLRERIEIYLRRTDLLVDDSVMQIAIKDAVAQVTEWRK
jgi:hypothetical protein